MRRIKGLLGPIAALMLLFYAGGNVAFADGGRGHGDNVHLAASASGASATDSTKVEARVETEASSVTKAPSDSKAPSDNKAPSDSKAPSDNKAPSDSKAASDAKAKEPSKAASSTQSTSSGSTSTPTGKTPKSNHGTLKIHA